MALAESEILKILMNGRTRISAAAWLVVRDTQAAEDIFQNVALKAMTKDVVFEAEGAVMSWAFITARREGIDWIRKRQRESVLMEGDVQELMEREWIEEGPQIGGARVEALRHCLEKVPEKSRLLVRMRYFEGYNCDDVAKRLGVELNAVYKRLSRLHQRLRECVEMRIERATSASTGRQAT